MTSEFTAISKRCSFALEGETFLLHWMVREDTTTCWFFQKRNPSRFTFKRWGNSKVSEYWHLFFITENCLIFLSLQTFSASKFALGDFPRQLGKESSPVLLIYLASCCAWWQCCFSVSHAFSWKMRTLNSTLNNAVLQFCLFLQIKILVQLWAEQLVLVLDLETGVSMG